MNGKAAVFTAIGLILGLLGGLAIGSSMGDDRAPAPTPMPAIGMDEQGEQPDDKTTPLQGEPEAETEDRKEPVSATHAPQLLRELMKQADIPAIPSGDGEITGSVKTASGEPLAGVEISAGSSYPDSMGYDKDTAEERIAARMRYEKWKDMARRTATTADDGTYRLTGLHEQTEYHLSAKLSGWQFDRTERGNYRLKSGDTCDFIAHVAMKLEVSLYMPDGSLAKSGRVTGKHNLKSGNSSTSDNVTNGVATLDLREGTWIVTAEAGSESEYKSESVTIEVVRDQPLQPIKLKLLSRPGVRGKIVRSEGAPDVRAQVYLQSNPPSEPPAEHFGNENDYRRARWGRDEFTYFDLEPGPYRLLLVSYTEVLSWLDVTVTNSLLEVELTLPPPDKADFIIVRVYSPTGDQLRDVDFHLTLHSSNGSSGRGGGEILHSDGSYWLPKNAFSEGRREVGGWFSVEAKHSSYGSKTVRYEMADTHELEMRFVKPATVTLTVANFNDHPLRDKFSWSLRPASKDDDLRSHSIGGRRGEGPSSSPFTLGPVEPGEYLLVLFITDGSYNTREITSQRVSLTGGENNLSALVPTLYTLTVSTTEVSVSRLEIRGKGNSFSYRAFRSRGSDEHKLVVEGIPRGTYIVQSDEGGMEVVVNGDTQVAFEPKPFDCLVLAIEPGSAMELAGFMTGDKVVGVDGEEFEILRVAYIKLQSSFAKENTSWTVLRNGARTEVTFNGVELMKSLESGKRGMDMRPGFQAE